MILVQRRESLERMHLAAGDDREIYWHSRGVLLMSPGGSRLLREVRHDGWSIAALDTAVRLLTADLRRRGPASLPDA